MNNSYYPVDDPTAQLTKGHDPAAYILHLGFAAICEHLADLTEALSVRMMDHHED